MVASMLRRDAARLMKAVLAGTKTKHFTDVIEAAFVGDEAKLQPDIKKDLPEEAEEEEEEEPEEGKIETPEQPSTSTLSKAMKRKAPAPTETGSEKVRVLGKRTGCCKLRDATPLYPTTVDKDRYLHTGVEEAFFSARKCSAVGKEAGYICQWSTVMKERGNIVHDCKVFLSTKGQLTTHIRQMHLGVAMVCYICNKRAWSGNTWFNHMKSQHPALAKSDYYVKEGVDVEQLQKITVKEEVDPTDI